MNQKITRFQQLILLNGRFGFLILKILLDVCNDKYIWQKIDELRNIYDDIDSDELKSEVRKLRRLMSSSNGQKETDIPAVEWLVATFLAWIVQ